MKTKIKPVYVGAALLFLCVAVVAVRALRHEAIPGWLIGFTGALCGIMFRILYEKRE